MEHQVLAYGELAELSESNTKARDGRVETRKGMEGVAMCVTKMAANVVVN